jgi:hypothetical protein
MNEVPSRLDELFRSSGGQPVELGGQLVRLAYTVPIGERTVTGRISVQSFKTEPVQGICLQMREGELEVNGVRNPGVVLWSDTAPRVIEFPIVGHEESALQVWNCWRGRFGEREAWIGSAGLICDEENGSIYHFFCSDGPGRTQFDAIVFDLAIDD